MPGSGAQCNNIPFELHPTKEPLPFWATKNGGRGLGLQHTNLPGIQSKAKSRKNTGRCATFINSIDHAAPVMTPHLT